MSKIKIKTTEYDNLLKIAIEAKKLQIELDKLKESHNDWKKCAEQQGKNLRRRAKEQKQLKTKFDKLKNNNVAKTVCISHLSGGVAILWDSVTNGMHDARSLVGDTTLAMQETLMDLGIDARGKEALKNNNFQQIVIEEHHE